MPIVTSLWQQVGPFFEKMQSGTKPMLWPPTAGNGRSHGVEAGVKWSFVIAAAAAAAAAAAVTVVMVVAMLGLGDGDSGGGGDGQST